MQSIKLWSPWLCLVLLILCSACASQRPIPTSSTTPLATNEQPNAPCVEVAKGESISIECVSGIPHLTINLTAVQFVKVEGREMILGTFLKDQSLTMVGDFNPGWSQGDGGKVEGDIVRFSLEKFSKHDGSHRVTVRVGGGNTWLFLEGLEKSLQLVTLSYENDWKESIAIGLWVWPDGKITAFKTNLEGLDHITVRAGLMGPWKRVRTRTESVNTSSSQPQPEPTMTTTTPDSLMNTPVTK